MCFSEFENLIKDYERARSESNPFYTGMILYGRDAGRFIIRACRTMFIIRRRRFLNQLNNWLNDDTERWYNGDTNQKILLQMLSYPRYPQTQRDPQYWNIEFLRAVKEQFETSCLKSLFASTSSCLKSLLIRLNFRSVLFLGMLAMKGGGKDSYEIQELCRQTLNYFQKSSDD